MTPDQRKAHEKMMETLEEIEFWLKRIAQRIGADRETNPTPINFDR